MVILRWAASLTQRSQIRSETRIQRLGTCPVRGRPGLGRIGVLDAKSGGDLSKGGFPQIRGVAIVDGLQGAA